MVLPSGRRPRYPLTDNAQYEPLSHRVDAEDAVSAATPFARDDLAEAPTDAPAVVRQRGAGRGRAH